MQISGLAGALAGITEGFINCPFETVKVRMQAGENRQKFKVMFILDSVERTVLQCLLTRFVSCWVPLSSRIISDCCDTEHL